VNKFYLSLISILFFCLPLMAAEQAIVVQSTTSTKNSGLYDYILPAFTAQSGIRVHVVAVGTGAAIKNAMNCDGDVLLVHSRAREEAFVSAGFSPRRYDLMYNDFILIGPEDDPAGIRKIAHAPAALAKIAKRGALFVSRGDDSGTHIKELALWQAAEYDPALDSGSWYREAGTGMGATLNIAIGLGAYTLTDRATWINFAHKSDFQIHVQGDERLFNPYGVMRLNQDKCPNTHVKEAQIFIDWLLSDKGQHMIATYQIEGQPLFFTYP